MFDELNAAFPEHTNFYEVNGLVLSEAMERCARLTGDNGLVFNYNGKIIFAVKHWQETTDIEWLNPVAGSPIEGTASVTPPNE
jgi:hypothetical protein